MARNLLLIVAILSIAVLCTGCNTNITSVDSLPTYSIISDDEFGIGNKNREVAISLEEPATETELESIAHKIKSGNKKSYEKTNIHYYLPGMKPGEGAWATANFAPDIKVNIYGDSPTPQDISE